MKVKITFLCLATGFFAFLARADPIIPFGKYPMLDALIAKHERQFYLFNAYPFGLSLNVHVKDEKARSLIQAFLDQADVADFKTFAGVHHHELMTAYGEHGDLGFFGGVALAGTAFRYMALKQEGAPKEVLEEARRRVVRAAESWHVFYVVTGGNGVVARGIVRLKPENPEDPPIPGLSEFVPVPLKDEQGNPLPQPKDNGSYREDLSAGLLPEGTWGWIDSASKDQLTGQVLGLVALYDAMKDDPDIDQTLVERLRIDAVGVARMLMQKHEISGLEGPIGSGEYDLIIMDADGRPTKYHDLNPLSLEKFYQPHDSPVFNVLNLVLALGVLKGLHHVSGDEELERFLYEEFLGRRGYLEKLANFDGPNAFNYIYLGLATNTDNPDLTSVALFITLYTETDEEVAAVVGRFLEAGWWAPKNEPMFCASRSKQPLWHAIYLSVTEKGGEKVAEVREELARLLTAFPLGGYWQDTRINCDEEEIAKRECVAIDGKTILHLAGQTPGGDWLATEALDPSIRPNSDFNARSNAFEVNGWGDGLRLNPGGDLLAAYWIARALQVKAEGQRNISPFARPHIKVFRPEGENEQDLQGAADTAEPEVASSLPESVWYDQDILESPDTLREDAALDLGPDSLVPRGKGGGCRVSSPAHWWSLLLMFAIWRVRRTRS